MTVKEIYDWIDSFAPFESQENFDNSGLLIGNADHTVKSVLFALDATADVVQEAIENQVDLIITHHPLIFHPLKSILSNEYQGSIITDLIKNNISLISAHTNLDQSVPGVNHALSEKLSLLNIEGSGYYRVGDLIQTITAEEAAQKWSQDLQTTVRVYGNRQAKIRRVGLSSGAGSEFWDWTLSTDAQAFVCGEVKHHHALEAISHGIVVFECGHYATEEPGIFDLANALQMHVNKLK